MDQRPIFIDLWSNSMKNLFKTGLILSLFFIITALPAQANEPIAGDSARLKSMIINQTSLEKNQRVLQLKDYLEEQNSTLTGSAQAFIEAADKNDLDWRLLPAIAGVESAFGKLMPKNSFNPFGWGIYDNQVRHFSSFQEAIEAVAKGLAEKYPQRIEAIARVYCPPNCNKWLNGVLFFINEIDPSAAIPEELELTI